MTLHVISPCAAVFCHNFCTTGRVLEFSVYIGVFAVIKFSAGGADGLKFVDLYVEICIH
jgi:hypothetical protein